MSKLLREYDSEHHFLFSHVLRFSEKPDEYDDHGYMIPNVMRRVLDVFLAFKCPGGGGLPGQLDKLCTDYPELDRERLAALERLGMRCRMSGLDGSCCPGWLGLTTGKAPVPVVFCRVDPRNGRSFRRLWIVDGDLRWSACPCTIVRLA
jgi:hypothetical protein